MFTDQDKYDLDAAKQKVIDKKLVLDLFLDIQALQDLLIKHGIIGGLEYDACRKYICTLPSNKAALDFLARQMQEIERYRGDPQARIRDLFNAKLNGL